ncbi:MAG: transketolase C-terminal domain-containing protein, partial [Raoultibacter sp.]
VRKGSDVAILAFGRMVGKSMEAAELLAADGIEARVVDMRWVKPLDTAAIAKAAKLPRIVTVEEGVIAGGAGEGVLEELAALGLQVPVTTLGIADAFVSQGKTDLLLRDLGLDGEGIAQSVREALR